MRHLFAQRRLAMLLCGAALLLKLMVPTGYMIGTDHGRLAITVCSGTAPGTMTMAMPGMHGGSGDHGTSKEHGKTEMPCAFAGLSAAMLAAVDPVLLAGLIAFVMAIGLVGTVLPTPSAAAHLRPPLRGPPSQL
jgi:hypothetical protein